MDNQENQENDLENSWLVNSEDDCDSVIEQHKLKPLDRCGCIDFYKDHRKFKYFVLKNLNIRVKGRKITGLLKVCLLKGYSKDDMINLMSNFEYNKYMNECEKV
jgi:hypothetical protein